MQEFEFASAGREDGCCASVGLVGRFDEFTQMSPRGADAGISGAGNAGD